MFDRLKARSSFKVLYKCIQHQHVGNLQIPENTGSFDIYVGKARELRQFWHRPFWHIMLVRPENSGSFGTVRSGSLSALVLEMSPTATFPVSTETSDAVSHWWNEALHSTEWEGLGVGR